MYLRQNSTICYELSRITTSILRAFYELFHGLLRVYYVLVTTCLRVVTNSDEYVRVLTIFCQKYINPANLNVSSFDNWHPERQHGIWEKQISVIATISTLAPSTSPEGRGRGPATTRLLRAIYGFLRAVYGWLRVVASGLRYLRIVTSYLRENQSMDNRQKMFDMSNNLPLLSRIFNSFCELWRVIYGYQRTITDACDWLRVGDP